MVVLVREAHEQSRKTYGSPRVRAELAANHCVHVSRKRWCPGVNRLHHSDQGSTYASEDYQDVLVAHGITCAMSRKPRSSTRP